ncbi:GntR family transcriptional regulator [Actinoplanes flavus]|uniref:GntR family transcriptional regulator n=1 Tax=Actinoplanes flavus TaxID=2820290 RepID=A0ABS3UKN2_9ACTN|nr:GntR family transcriptional regulator [Actinoplanes flavus]MBO3739350.1 GntR family transcriptional regulator [Actinoplanes flavus]
MIVTIDPDSTVPPYDQIREQLTTMIQAGVLAAGVRLPSIRQLAADLGLAPNTVARSYRELESAGLIVTRVGRGTTVSQPPTLSAAERQRLLRAAAASYLATAARLGHSVDEAIAALRPGA